MGRPPTHGAPSFRFHGPEVAEMESIIREHGGIVPPRDLLLSLASKFSNSPDRAGKSTVQMKQVWNWFQNRRYALRSKLVKPNLLGEVVPVMNVHPVLQHPPIPSGHNVVRNTSENPPMEFEAKSARDGAWYDVQAFLSHRYFETGNPEVLVRFVDFGQGEDEWVNVRKHVRQRSLPCESLECIVVLPGDLILCFQEGKEQALYFDAHVLDAQRRRHDVRGCRCRFLVRYDHDQSEEIVALRKVCRRPETDYRLQMLHSTNEYASASSSVAEDSKRPAVDPASTFTLMAPNPNPFPSHTIANPTVPHPTVSPATASASASASSSTPAPSVTLISAPTSTWSSLSSPSPIPAPAPIQAPALASASSPDPAPSLTPISSPTPSTSVSAPDPHLNRIIAPIPSLIQVGASEVKKIESDTPAASSAGETSARENIKNPSASSIIMEVKLEEISIPKEVAGGSNVSQGETSESLSLANDTKE